MSLTSPSHSMRVAAIGDLHITENSQGAFQPLISTISKEADILAICGDITDQGELEEAEVAVGELKASAIPIVCVLGNHDYENGHEVEIQKMLEEINVIVLEGDSTVVDEVGFAGVKGFGGGFEKYLLAPWGEKTLKLFVQEAVNDMLKLESALARLETEKKVVILHYTPIRETLEGESLEIFPFLGSSRLVHPINRFEVDAVFHGHAHHGRETGKTNRGIPVYNTSFVLLKRLQSEKPYVLVNI